MPRIDVLLADGKLLSFRDIPEANKIIQVSKVSSISLHFGQRDYVVEIPDGMIPRLLMRVQDTIKWHPENAASSLSVENRALFYVIGWLDTSKQICHEAFLNEFGVCLKQEEYEYVMMHDKRIAHKGRLPL